MEHLPSVAWVAVPGELRLAGFTRLSECPDPVLCIQNNSCSRWHDSSTKPMSPALWVPLLAGAGWERERRLVAGSECGIHLLVARIEITSKSVLLYRPRAVVLFVPLGPYLKIANSRPWYDRSLIS